MNVIFDKCSDAVKCASETRSFGIFHSTDNQPNLNIHTHECCEVFLCIKGGKNFLIDDKIYSVYPNDLFIMNQFEAHKITFEENAGVERYVFQIHPDFIFSASTDKTDLSRCFYRRDKKSSNRIPLSCDDCVFLISKFKELSKESAFGDDVIKNSVMALILAFINEKFINYHPLAELVSDARLEEAISYINLHLAEDINLESIAKNSYISVNQLCKIFKTSLGTTVKKYIIGKRISQAKKYLLSGKSVSETAYMCGFRDYSNFIRTFVKTVGISPGKYCEKK